MTPLAGQLSLFEDRSAVFSEDRRYRYLLTRLWDEQAPLLTVIGLNPSTATETVDDPTIRRCINYARAWGCGGLLMTNLFGFRATDPREMKRQPEPVGPGNDAAIVDAVRRAVASGGLAVAAWGVHGAHLGRADAVLSALAGEGLPLHCLGTTSDGHPRHPLYLRADLRPRLYEGRPTS